MSYTTTPQGFITCIQADGSTLFLPPDDNGTPEWAEYQAWLDAGNTPEPAPPPPPTTLPLY